MKPATGLVRLSIFVCLLGVCTANGCQSFAQETKKKDDQVKLESKQVELIEVLEAVSDCPNQKGTKLRIKVVSESAIDVRIHAQNLRGRWYTNDFKGKTRGQEISLFTCLVKGKFKVQTRAASDKPWF